MLSRTERLRLLRPIIRLAVRYVDAADPWACIEHPAPAQLFGPGARQGFSWYFSGESRISVQPFEDLCSFLLGCSYVADSELFQEPDFWQHPLTFEQLRRGDCEDHALWAWRKLRELGHPAHLVSGSCGLEVLDPNGHAWVLFEAQGELFLFEATTKRRDAMVYPLAQMRHAYNPWVSIDHEGRIFLYGGLLQRSNARAEAKRQRREKSAPPAPEAAGAPEPN